MNEEFLYQNKELNKLKPKTGQMTNELQQVRGAGDEAAGRAGYLYIIVSNFVGRGGVGTHRVQGLRLVGPMFFLTSRHNEMCK